ncbi:MAG: hypothetical protein OHK93_005199 [Ramalina farinacea]|uniref:Methyltransferase domain-containing protein n=1 Tax=Ramalina farinacea TaxID=258253 RepID=A0AA43U129_9LECA|nr:hypothetical protein [Ramalina farinacea]
MGPQSQQIQFDPRYVASLLLDEANIVSANFAAGRELLRQYSKIPENELASHVADIHHLYPSILSRLHEGAAYLDVGCCLAQDIRKLAFDGAPTTNCIGIDLEPGFFTISEALFRDEGCLSARFFQADIFQSDDTLLTDIRGSMDVVHASSFFHLFGLPKQRQVARTIAKVVRPQPGSLVLGLQIAAAGEAETIPVFSEGEPTYCHSLVTMQALWDDTVQEAGLEEQEHALSWKVGLKKKPVPANMRIGHLANPKLIMVMWIAELVLKSSTSK